MDIRPRDIVMLIELEKKKAELNFKKTVLGIDTSEELIRISSDAIDLSRKMKSASIELVFPFDDQLKGYDARISVFTNEDIKEAMKSKSGDAYILLKEKGGIVKRNFANRSEIAKLSIVLAKLDGGQKAALGSAIRKGKIENEVDLAGVDDLAVKVAARSLLRCGIGCAPDGSRLKPDAGSCSEIRFELSNRVVYIADNETKDKLDMNLKRIAELNKTIQLKTAVRQIQTFSDDEDKEFADLQRKYLDLLYEQDDLLKDFYLEDTIAVTIPQ